MKKILFLLMLCLASTGMLAENEIHNPQPTTQLWYSSPATCWLEAMPLGNSHLGAMEFGGTEWEELQLNEETFWSGSPHSNNSDRSLSRLDEVRKLIFSGQEEKAADIIDKDFIVGPHGMRYLTLGSMKLHFEGHQSATGYYRDLDIATATATTTYKVGDVTYTRTTFASLTDGVIVMNIKADKPGALQFSVGYDCPLKNTIIAKKNQLIATIQNVEQEGIPAGLTANTIIQVETDGKLLTGDNTLSVATSSETTIYISAATNYVNYKDVSADPKKKAQAYLTALKKTLKTPSAYETLLSRHTEAYKKQFDRVRLTLPESNTSLKETPQRVADFAKDGTDQALRATQIVDPANKAFADSLAHAISMIPPMQVGRHNQLQEWLQDADDPRDDHRHISQLYGLYPSNQVSPYSHPELFQAARNTLLQRGDMATGWSLGWKTNFWARMLDGNHAYTIISNMLHLLPNEGQESQHPDGRTFPNLFDAHPPFQIDGNFGVCAGIAEMLMQSHDGALHILPALPDAWKNGEIRGILARGGFVIDTMQWKANQLETVTITSRLGGNLRLRSYTPLTTTHGNTLTPVSKGSNNPNPFYSTADIKTPLISKEITPQLPLLYHVYEYDINTKPGDTITFVRK
ncbi:MAG: glycoside hydrolase family 95 protein [Bacteroidales bacterium]|nr:glycoside hydrolase family 95 protein [Bacteroidales bacterium]